MRRTLPLRVSRPRRSDAVSPMSKAPSRRRDDVPSDPAERRGLFTIHVRATPNSPLGGRVTRASTGEVHYFDSPDELIRYLIDRTGSVV